MIASRLSPESRELTPAYNFGLDLGQPQDRAVQIRPSARTTPSSTSGMARLAVFLTALTRLLTATEAGGEDIQQT